MKRPLIAIGVALTLLLASSALCAAATGEELIPPGNSAATQYTEAIPTPSGNKATEESKKKGHGPPSSTLGSRNAKRLEKHGQDGRAAAAAAAETAPSPTPAPSSEDEAETAAPPVNKGGGTGGGASGGDKEKAPSQGNGAKSTAGLQASVEVDEPSGSSGFGEAVGEATGTSGAGQLGWLLPLLIIATAIWAFAYARRHRRRVG